MMKNIIKKVYLGLVLGFFIFLGVNGQYIKFQTGEETLKIFCPYQKNIIFDTDGNGENAFGFYLTLDFDPSKFDIEAGDFSIGNLFQHLFLPGLYNGIFGSNSKLIAQDNTIDDTNGKSNGLIGTLTFKSKKVLSGEIFINSEGFGVNDVVGDTDLLKSDSSDFIKNTSGAKYFFQTGLCSPDQFGPIINNFYPNIEAQTRTVGNGFRTLGPVRNVSEKIYSQSGLSFWVKDGDYYTKNQPGYTSGNFGNLNFDDYENNVADRSSGINPDSLQFKVSPTNTIFDKNNVYIISGNQRTWDRRTRDYRIKINGDQLNDFGIEGNTYFTSHIAEFSLKTQNRSIIFNQIVAPWLTDLYPNNGEVQVLPISDVKLAVRDDRAGINTSSIVVKIRSGNQVLGIFSGADLHLTADLGNANSSDFFIHIFSGTNGLEFPIPTVLNTANTITVEVFVEDMNGNNPRDRNSPQNTYDRYNFDTRYSCNSYPGCSNALKIFTFFEGNWIENFYYETSLYVTGTLEAGLDTGNKILNCGEPLITERLETNIHGAGLEQSYNYSGQKLYIEGGTVSYMSGGKIVINAF